MTLVSLAAVLGLGTLSLSACDGSEQGDGTDEHENKNSGGSASGTSNSQDTGDTGDTGDNSDTGGVGENSADADADADGDGLSDAEEAELGTDPNRKDTDDDTYWDSWEVAEGTDPLDKESRIYTGYWPYYPDKEELEQGTWAAASHTAGSPFARFQYEDQHGESVDIYDFAHVVNDAGDEVFIVIDISTVWCGPCNDIADWIGTNTGPSAEGLETSYPTMRDKVHNREIFWITVLYEDAAHEPAQSSDAVAWSVAHPDQAIPVLVDQERQMAIQYGSKGIPFFFIVDPAMAVEYWPPTGSGYQTLSIIESYL